MSRKSRLSKEVIKGPWSAQEDEVLANYITLHGEGKWRDLPHKAGLNRCGKSCRLRWLNYLKPGVKRGKMSPDEEDLIIRMHKLIGNRWSLIAGRLPGRTDNEIKNYWNTNLSKKIHGNKISRGQKRKPQHNQNQETTDKSTNSVCKKPSVLAQQVLASSSGLQVASDYVNENTLEARRNDPNASTDQEQKEIVDESDDNNYLMNTSSGANVADQMSLTQMDFPIAAAAEVATKTMMVDNWDWSVLANPFLLHDEWDLNTVDTFLSSEQNWIFEN